jgi:gliding motility-associated lipoprotein GldH
MIFRKIGKSLFSITGNIWPGCKYLLPAACCFVYASCTQLDNYEKNTSIPKYEWHNSFTVKDSFSITDISVKYNVYAVLRHTDAYKYNNIWLNIGIQAPGDSMRYQKVDMLLGSDANGWTGTGMNDIWEVRQLLTGASFNFNVKGTYKFSITQIMRDEPLPAVMSAGLRVEKQ